MRPSISIVRVKDIRMLKAGKRNKLKKAIRQGNCMTALRLSIAGQARENSVRKQQRISTNCLVSKYSHLQQSTVAWPISYASLSKVGTESHTLTRSRRFSVISSPSRLKESVVRCWLSDICSNQHLCQICKLFNKGPSLTWVCTSSKPLLI